jgi:membrane protein DedA with SNARE-associated domain
MRKTKIIWMRVFIYLAILGLMSLEFQDLFNPDAIVGAILWMLLLAYIAWTVRNSFMKDDAFENIKKIETK